MELYEGNEPYIFVSYSHKDTDRVLPYIQALSDGGFRVWYDVGTEAGTEWPAYIEDHLKRSAVVVIFMSEAAVDSRNCRNEINLAHKIGKAFLVVYLEETDLRDGMDLQLSSSQSLYANRHPSVSSVAAQLCAARLLIPCKAAAVTPSVPPVVPADAEHLYQQGLRSLKGDGVPKDESAAARYFRTAAEQGHARAQYNLGLCYDRGVGVPKSEADAIGWYKKAADQNHPQAQYNLGLCHLYGTVDKNEAAAVQWIYKAAMQGHIRAQYTLAHCYETGIGTQTDKAQAIFWYRKAAEQDFLPAKTALERL